MKGATSSKGSHVFALTGGIGSGKSSVAAVFREAGVPVVDADQMAREAVAPGSATLAGIAQSFGPEILNDDASLNRAALARLVFGNDEARARLDALVHPRVRELVRGAFQRLSDEGHAWVCYDIPLLFETRQEDAYRPVVVVSCTPEQQVERAAQRDGLSKEAIWARLSAQIPLNEKVERADVIVRNEGPESELRERALQALCEVQKKC